MATEKLGFEDFLAAVAPENIEFVREMNDFLLANDCKSKVENKSSGYFISYTHTKTKHSVINLLFRKQGMIIRIYGENAQKYGPFLDTLPDEFAEAIRKAAVCKRLINPADCSSTCKMGYDYMLRGERMRKCRYSGFMFGVTPEVSPAIRAFVGKEMDERMKA